MNINPVPQKELIKFDRDELQGVPYPQRVQNIWKKVQGTGATFYEAEILAAMVEYADKADILSRISWGRFSIYIEGPKNYYPHSPLHQLIADWAPDVKALRERFDLRDNWGQLI